MSEKIRIRRIIVKLRKKEAKKVIEKVKEYGVELEKGDIERVEIDGNFVLLYNGEPIFMEFEERVYFTLYGIMKLKPKKWKVVVDEGAMPYVLRGADIMKPGIVHADEGIKKGDFVYVLVEGKESPIAVGIALCDGLDMVKGEKSERKGKAIKNIHHLKDKIWNAFFGGCYSASKR